MDDETFLHRLSIWEIMPDAEEQWVAKCETLCELYLQATPEQRAQLPDLIAPEHDAKFFNNLIEWTSLRGASVQRVWNLVFYMREAASRIRSKDDVYQLRLGLAGAAIVGGGMDFRDSLVSLSFLHRAATEAGIDPAPHFREIADMTRPVIRDFMRDFLKRSSKDIESMVKAFSD